MDDPASSRAPEREIGDTGHGEAAPEHGERAAAAAETSEAPARSARGREAGEAIRALAHTARSFILYDPSNEKIRDFLEDVRARIFAYLQAHGELTLEVRPAEILVGGEVVYKDRDREHSLAFRLYRDGVRTLKLAPDLDWNELICLIGILSVRYKGFRTQEDDIVTLLWRADFKHIEATAVEGVVASEEDASDRTPGGLAGQPTSLEARIFRAPFAFDVPWPNFNERAPVEFRPVPATLLGRFAEEDGNEAVHTECLAFIRELMAGLGNVNDPLPLDDALPALQETAAFLASEDRIAEVVEAMHAVQRFGPTDPTVRAKLLGACADETTVRRCLRTLQDDLERVPPAVLELLSLSPGDHLGALLDLFATRAGRASPIVRQLLEGQLRGQGARIASHLGGLDGQDAVELFRMIAKADPSGAVDSAIDLLGRPDEELQLEALRFLDQAPYGAKVGRALVGAFTVAGPAARPRLFALLARHHERRAFEPLVELVTRGAGTDLTVAEAQSAGEALALLDADRARPLFRDWVRPPGLRRLAPGAPLLRWAAVSGLALLPGGETEELLEWLLRHGSDELEAACTAALAIVRRKGAAPRA